MSKITDKEIKWLESCYPNLQYKAKAQKIVGELDFGASYDKESGKLCIGHDDENRERDAFICDVFDIEICLNSIDSNGWPKVYEVAGRHSKIAEKYNIEVIDLHFYSDDGACCLGIKSTSEKFERNFRIKQFMNDLVIPFFYRLSYTEKFGIDASSNDLWGEYSHGLERQIEHRKEILNLAKRNPNRNEPCPCGSDKKYKNCHRQEVEYIKRSHRQ